MLQFIGNWLGISEYFRENNPAVNLHLKEIVKTNIKFLLFFKLNKIK
jgi:hypothetical protein